MTTVDSHSHDLVSDFELMVLAPSISTKDDIQGNNTSQNKSTNSTHRHRDGQNAQKPSDRKPLLFDLSFAKPRPEKKIFRPWPTDDTERTSTNLLSELMSHIGKPRSTDKAPNVLRGPGWGKNTTSQVLNISQTQSQTPPQAHKPDEESRFADLESPDSIKVTNITIPSQSSSQTAHSGSGDLPPSPQDLDYSVEPHSGSHNTSKEYAEETSLESNEVTKFQQNGPSHTESGEINDIC